MATLENGENNAKSSRRGISFEFQSRDLPSKRLLGKGLSGIGYETAWKGARYARKHFVGVQRDIFLQEATVLVGLQDHKNIVKTYGWTVDKRSCSLVLEYMEEDLLSLLQKRMDSERGVVGKDLGKQSSTSTCMQPVDLPEAVDMMLQIATGVEYLHGQGLAHGDLKTKNILVTHRKDGEQSWKVLKLSDFGLVGTKRKSKYIVSRKVRKLDMVRWKSPESLKIVSRTWNGDEDETSSESESESTPSSVPDVSPGCAGTKSSDVYSFALICSQILTGHIPYPYVDWKELTVEILSGRRPDLPVSLPLLLRELLVSCWGDPAERPSFSAVRMQLKRVQGLLTTALGKRPQEAAAPSLADSPAHQVAVVSSRSFGNCLPLKPSRGPVIVPSEWATSLRSNTPGVPSAASSAPSPPATSAASPAADESYEPTQSEDLVKGSEEACTRDLITAFDPSMKRSEHEEMSFEQLFSTSSDLNNVPPIEQGSRIGGTRLLGRFILNEGGTSRICYRSAPEVEQTGTMDTGNSLFASSFETWRETRVLPPSQRKREKSKNQWLLRRCLETLTLQRDVPQGIQTHGAVSKSIRSQGPPPTSSRTSMPHRGAEKAPLGHMMAGRHRRSRLNDLFLDLRRHLPVESKSDKVAILGGVLTQLEDLKREIRELEMNKSDMERRYEVLQLSHHHLEQRNQQLRACKSRDDRDLGGFKPFFDRPQWQEATTNRYEDVKSSDLPVDLEHRNKQRETSPYYYGYP